MKSITVYDEFIKANDTAFWVCDLPKRQTVRNYRVDVDFIGHTSIGGILIGGANAEITAPPSQFHGYSCFIGSGAKRAIIGCYNQIGEYERNMVSSDEIIVDIDLHLSVDVYDNEFTFRVTSLDGKTHYYAINYTVGTHEIDKYEKFSDKVGLYRAEDDGGSFKNLRITVFEEDEIPCLDKKIDFGGFTFDCSDGLTQDNNAVFGSGAMLTKAPMADNFKAELTVIAENNTKLFFGMADENNGYAFEINKTNETLAFYKIADGVYNRLGLKKMPIYSGEHLAYVNVDNCVATVMFDNFFEKENAFWTFSFKLDDYKTGKFGVMLDGGVVKNLSVTESDFVTGETYTNPVNWGADPDVLFYDGTYFLYNRITAGNDIFRVYTSSDLVNWTACNTVFVNDPEIHNVKFYMSPNVTYFNGTFYLFYAARNENGSHRLYCATADSPYGPFTHKHGQIPLHDVPEIGGHPYIDENGRTYLSYVRFGNGNHIWIEEVILADDKMTPVEGTLRKIISPDNEYETDGYGNIAEGGVIHKHNGYYYMIYASGHYLGHYGETYAIAKDILGPYKKYEYGDILSWNKHINGVGDGIFVKSPDGKELWMVYHMHFSPNEVHPRYTCIDRLKFVKDPNGGPDILTVQGPSTTPQTVPSKI